MKKYNLILAVIFLIATAGSFQKLNGQDKTKDNKDKRMDQSIEQQKKALSDQKKANDEAEQELKDGQTDIENANKEIELQLENSDRDRTKIFMNMHGNRRNFDFGEPFVFTGQDMEGFNGHMGDAERTSWDFSKTIKDNTFSRDYTIDVDKTAKSVVMSVMGDCKSGEIKIKIIMPNGKSYSDILIDESGNLNWRKSFTLSENQDKAGDWKFQISSNKASGYFKISLQTY